MTLGTYISPLHQMTSTTATELWNDSCSIDELTYAIRNGATGATANPVIVGEVLNKEISRWEAPIRELIRRSPSASEVEIAWQVTEDMSLRAAELLYPIFEKNRGKNGRLSIQTNPTYYRDPERIVQQAAHFDSLAPNIIVKIPATTAGIPAMEEASYRGIAVNATVCFTVPQCLAVGAAIERGLERRRREGKPLDRIGSVCTVMVGRLDDWLKAVAQKRDIVTEPAYLEWAGVAVMKKAYRLFKERGYSVRMLSAATRNYMHWSEFIGGDVVVTLTHQWQKRFNASDVEVVSRIDNPVDPRIIGELGRKFEDFRRAYEENGMSVKEFDGYGATRRTLRQFIVAYERLLGVIRNCMLPDPDKD